MRVTVCQLHDERDLFLADWQQLVAHVERVRSDLVLLPEMPFCKWPFAKRTFDAALWRAAVHAHNEWETKLVELAPAIVLGTRPIDFGNERYNEGFAWDRENGLRSIHAKTGVPDKEGAREGSWYDNATPDFEPMALDVPSSDESIYAGFLIGDELWLHEQARLYGLESVHCLAMPRATGLDTDRWLAGGRDAAIAACAFGLSSNRVDAAGRFGGCAWIVAPDGEVLAVTNDTHPVVSATIDPSLTTARRAAALRAAHNIDAHTS